MRRSATILLLCAALQPAHAQRTGGAIEPSDAHVVLADAVMRTLHTADSAMHKAGIEQPGAVFRAVAKMVCAARIAVAPRPAEMMTARAVDAVMGDSTDGAHHWFRCEAAGPTRARVPARLRVHNVRIWPTDSLVPSAPWRLTIDLTQRSPSPGGEYIQGAWMKPVGWRLLNFRIFPPEASVITFPLAPLPSSAVGNTIARPPE